MKNVTPLDLGVHVVRELLSLSGAPADDVEELVLGNVICTSGSSPYLARHIGLQAGLPVSSPALLVNRLCGSGLEAVAQAALGVQTGRCSLAIAGGVENMSQAPHLLVGGRWGRKLGALETVDLLEAGLTDSHVHLGMGQTAERLAKSHSISRKEQDEWTVLSHSRAAKARDGGLLAEEIAPLTVGRGPRAKEFRHDELIRDDTNLEKLSQLPAVFEKDGTVSAGNSSGINDGASAMLVASEGYAKEKGLAPLAKIRSFAVRGCAPETMGIGPALAIPAALKQAGLSLGDMDLVEVNEAFAAQFLAVKKDLGLDPEKTNVNGGAIALGHPLGASGNRVLLTLLHELRRRDGRYGVASLCIGGGQGIAMVVER